MQHIRRILVTIKDPAAKSHPGVDKAAQIARGCDAQIELFHCIATPIYVDAIGDGSIRKFASESRTRSLAQLERIGRRLTKQGLRVTVFTDRDFPVYEAIVRRARECKADLIVAESHEGTRLLPWLLHLTDWELVRTSPMPVLIIKNARAYRKPVILAALDPTHAFAKPSRLDSEILRASSALRTALGGTLHAVHAYVPALPTPLPTGRRRTAAQDLKALVERAEKEAHAELDKVLRDADIPRARRHLVGHHPINAIQDVARDIGASIVAMGAISRSGLKRLFIGNTAERLLETLPCDVLVVKPTGFVSPVRRAKRGARFVTTAQLP